MKNTNGTCNLKRKVFHEWKRDAGFNQATFTITKIKSKGFTYKPSFNNVTETLVV